MCLNMESTPGQVEEHAKWKAEIKSQFDVLQEDQQEAGFQKGDTVNLMLQTHRELTSRVCQLLSHAYNS